MRTRDDGFIFDGHVQKNGVSYEVWRSPESWKKRREKSGENQRTSGKSDSKSLAIRAGSAARNRKRRAAMGDVINERRRKSYSSGGDSIQLERNKRWRKANWNKVLESRRKPQYAIAAKLRSRVVGATKTQGSRKSASTSLLIGCSIPDLMRHLEDRFTDGMSWNNHGEWHIDHIKPCASFDLTDPQQQRVCFNFTNLQPLWGVENLKKGSKLIGVGVK